MQIGIIFLLCRLRTVDALSHHRPGVIASLTCLPIGWTRLFKRCLHATIPLTRSSMFRKYIFPYAPLLPGRQLFPAACQPGRIRVTLFSFLAVNYSGCPQLPVALIVGHGIPVRQYGLPSHQGKFFFFCRLHFIKLADLLSCNPRTASNLPLGKERLKLSRPISPIDRARLST